MYCCNNIIFRLSVRTPIKSLPRESRALFVLYGVDFSGAGIKQNKTVISWTSLNLFNSNGLKLLYIVMITYMLMHCVIIYYVHLSSMLKSDDIVLGMWLGDDVDPLSSPSSNVGDKETSLLQVN